LFNFLVEQSDSTGDLVSIFAFAFLGEMSNSDQFREEFYISGQQDWVMEEFLMTLVAKYFRFAFESPWA